jgi:2-oxoglutarate dehydrogenase E1 component
MPGWDDFQGVNAAYVSELYDRYRLDPRAVDDETGALFERLGPPPLERAANAARSAATGRGEPATTPPGAGVRAVVGAVNLAESIRRYGHLAAQLDPLGTRPLGDPSLTPEAHGITDAELMGLPASLVGGDVCEHAASAYDAIQQLRRIYCATTGYDFAHIFVPEERDWLRAAVECGRFRAPADPIDPMALLERLTEVEVFERFLHRTFPGKTRFSLEGLDMLVPALDEVIAEAAEAGTRHILIGMAHRGRLNVMAHALHKPYAQILAEFKDPLRGRGFDEEMAWTGDVKYHMGASRAISGGQEVDLVVSMPPNPSHLEAVDPIVLGMARAAGTRVDRPGPPAFDPSVSLAILVHGDAAFPGQGVVAETLNLGRLPGYETGGTIHVIANNQLGFTTVPQDAYSTSYASGLARGFKIPIVHVNADDPEACVEVARLACAYRARFHRDFVIDLIGYRRFGHNEGDEPAFTQPLMYERIGRHPTVREIWARALVERRLVEEPQPDRLVETRMSALQQALESLQPEQDLVEPQPEPPPPGAAAQVATAVPLDRLRELNAGLLALPGGFTVHRKLEKARVRRGHALDAPDEPTVDWAAAEELALASILADGVAVRVTGEDVERGTFSQRHAVFHDARTGAEFIPLQALPQARAAFEIRNSPLTENAVIGFEYGYNVQEPGRLVLWEAQYGDFINGAQVMIDEFVASARVKWGQRPSLGLLLPHGHEGQGPDHASARPERFLQLAADINLRLANCTTAAQYFHLLRRQAALLLPDPLPLVVLTPKSLLRHPLVASTPRDLAEGRWQPVIDDAARLERRSMVRRLVLCSGKFFVDLATSPQREKAAEVAVVRIEQLYPFPVSEVRTVLEAYAGLEEVVWVQEEPENMGAWEFVRPELGAIIQRRWPLRGITRPRSASPAEGSAARHARMQRALVERALTLVEAGVPLERETAIRS